VDAEGSTIIAGFQDGVLRSFKVVYKGNQSPNNFELILVEVYKPHTQAITSISLDSKGELLATGVKIYLSYLS
jgi:hypothetical protein